MRMMMNNLLCFDWNNINNECDLNKISQKFVDNLKTCVYDMENGKEN
jgi:hypothetical protein